MGNHSLRTALYDLVRSDLLSVLGDGYMPSSPDGEHCPLPPDSDARKFACSALSKSIVKKFQDEIDEETTHNVARLKFESANSACTTWRPPSWSALSNEELYDAELVGEWRNQIYHFFETPPNALGYSGALLDETYPEYDWSVVLDASKIAAFADTGPGANIGAVGNTFIEKFDKGDLTYGDNHLKWLWEIRTMDHAWRDLEISRLMRDHALSQVSASKLTFVPKTVHESRTICVEPILNTFFQKGAQWLLELQLKLYFGIDLATQQGINRELARLGSIDGSYATIDLTSASDMISKELVEWAVPAHQLKYLSWLRMPSAVYGNDVIPLHMFSTMGNATTFPLQTAIFAAAVAAVYKLHGIKMERRRSFTLLTNACGQRTVHTVRQSHEGCNWGVNGDDIIVVRECYDDTIRLLKLLGFLPNRNKSFNEGFFRESCGADFYKGTNVRGVYATTLRTDQDINSLLNRLMNWSVTHNVDLPNTCAWLSSRLKLRLLVPMHDEETAGIRVVTDCLPKRFRRTHKHGLVGFPYQKWEPKPSVVARWDNGSDEGGLLAEEQSSGWGCWPFSLAATVLSILRGELRGCVLTRRQDEQTHYRAVWEWTHAWDSRPLVGGPWQHGLVPLTEDYKLSYQRKLLSNRIIR